MKDSSDKEYVAEQFNSLLNTSKKSTNYIREQLGLSSTYVYYAVKDPFKLSNNAAKYLYGLITECAVNDITLDEWIEDRCLTYDEFKKAGYDETLFGREFVLESEPPKPEEKVNILSITVSIEIEANGEKFSISTPINANAKKQ